MFKQQSLYGRTLLVILSHRDTQTGLSRMSLWCMWGGGVASSANKFGEISQLWQNLKNISAILCEFIKYLSYFGTYFDKFCMSFGKFSFIKMAKS